MIRSVYNSQISGVNHFQLAKPISQGLTFSNLNSADSYFIVQIDDISPDDAINSPATNEKNSVQSFLNFRKCASWVFPTFLTLCLGLLSFVQEGALLESIAEPMANLLDATSLFTIISDLTFTVLPGAFEAVDVAKKSFEHNSIKSILFVLGKFIPLFFIAKIFLGKGFVQRAFKGEKIISKESLLSKVLRKEESIASITEATKAQITNFGGRTLITSPLRSIIWWVRAQLCKGPLSRLAIIGLKDPASPKAVLIQKAVATSLLAIMDSWRVGIVTRLIHWIATTFPSLHLDERHNIVTLN